MELTPEIGMLWRQSWRPTSESSTSGLVMREAGCSAGGLDHVTAERPIPEPMRPISVHRRSPAGAANEGQPQFAASRMGVGPLHTIDEVTEGNEVMEKRERQEGITPGQAKGQTQRWQPLQPNLERVNEAARRSGQTRFTALLHHVDVAALERAFRRQRRAASPGIDRVTVEDYERNLEGNLQRLHAQGPQRAVLAQASAPHLHPES